MSDSNRITRLRLNLDKVRIDGLIISSSYNIGYLTGFFGFSKIEREAFLLVAQPQGLTHKTPGVFGYIFTDGRYFEAVKKIARDFELIEISSKSSIYKEIKRIIKKEKIKRLGFEKNNLTFAEYKELQKCLKTPLIPIENLVESLRMIKMQDEIIAIEKACKLTDKTFTHILKKIKRGVSEKDLATEIEFFIKKAGSDISFPPIVAYGVNSSVPHHQSTHNSKLITHNQIVLFDFGAKVDNFCSDMTRAVFFGKANREQKRMYKTVLEAQNKSIEHLGRQDTSGVAEGLPRGGGIKAKDVDKVARDYIVNSGYPTIPHSLGHGIGLEVHELPRFSPRSRDKLKPGMVFSIEPGIYIPGFGGVRIEDLVALSSSGPKLLTKAKRALIEV